MNKRYIEKAVAFITTGSILLAGLTVSMAGDCGGGSTEAGKSVNPAEVRERSDDTLVKPRSVPNPYPDDVIQTKKKMQSSEDPQPKTATDGNGDEVDRGK